MRPHSDNHQGSPSTRYVYPTCQTCGKKHLGQNLCIKCEKPNHLTRDYLTKGVVWRHISSYLLSSYFLGMCKNSDVRTFWCFVPISTPLELKFHNFKVRIERKICSKIEIGIRIRICWILIIKFKIPNQNYWKFRIKIMSIHFTWNNVVLSVDL